MTRWRRGVGLIAAVERCRGRMRDPSSKPVERGEE